MSQKNRALNHLWEGQAQIKPKSYRPEGRRTPYQDLYNGVTG